MSRRVTLTDEEIEEIYKLLKAEYNVLPSGLNYHPVVSMGRNRIAKIAEKLGYGLKDTDKEKNEHN